jgi:hypothetical protein
VCAHFVPRLLTPDKKKQRAAQTVGFPETIDDDRTVSKRAVRLEGNLCFMYDPETKRQSAN